MQSSRVHKRSHSRSASNSPQVSPNDEREDPFQTVAFVSFEAGSSSTLSNEARRAIRVQAARASASTRKKTLARKLAEKNNSTVLYDFLDTSSASSPTSPTTESDQSRRTSASTTSAISGPESETVKAALSANPSQLHSAAPMDASALRHDSVTARDPHLSLIMDYFDWWFLPDETTAHDTHGREAMRTYLYPMAGSRPCLLNALLLIAGSHAAATNAHAIDPKALARLKSDAIEQINNDITRAAERGGIDDAVIGSMALLAAWELEYGTAEVYDLHMSGLKAIVNDMRGGIDVAKAKMHPAIMNLILDAGHDLPVMASTKPCFEMTGDAALQSSPSPLWNTSFPPGFEELKNQRLVMPDLAKVMATLADVTKSFSAGTMITIQPIYQTLLNWRIDTSSATSYSATRTVKEDAIIRQVCLHVRLAGLAICEMAFQQSTGPQPMLIARQQNLYGEALQFLGSNLMVGTVFEDLIFWSLFTICAAIDRCDDKHLHTLRRLQRDLGIRSITWAGLRDRLGRFAYPHSPLMADRALSLLRHLQSSQAVIGVQTERDEPSRYKRGLRRPATWVGDAVDAASPED